MINNDKTGIDYLIPEGDINCYQLSVTNYLS